MKKTLETERPAMERVGWGTSARPQPIEWNKEQIEDLLVREFRTDTVSKGIRRLTGDLKPIRDTLPTQLPPSLRGTLIFPDGRPAARVAVVAERPPTRPRRRDRRARDDDYDGRTAQPVDAPWVTPATVTDEAGRFAMRLPDSAIPADGLLLTIRGKDTRSDLRVRPADLRSGRIGVQDIDRPLQPLDEAVAKSLKSEPDAVEGTQEAFELGQGDCARRFSSNAGVIDRFRWSTLIRLVEPDVMPKHAQVDTDDGPMKVPEDGTLAGWLYRDAAQREGDRIPIGEPIDVDRFRRELEDDPSDVPKAASLALGYIVRMTQSWIPRGLSLGNLLYALPLAPGEQQRVVVTESVERLTVRESESSSLRERQSQRDRVSRTTQALFGAALDEANKGGSRFSEGGSSSNIGGGFSILGIGASGGGSWSSGSGSSSSWQRSSRDFVSWSAESFHSSLSRRAAASRRVQSASVRLASASDRDSVATKVVTNHNRTHALTMQYWEVLRNYTVTTDIEDVQLVCYIPMEIIQWLPRFQPEALPASVDRDDLVRRYRSILNHASVLRRRFWRGSRFRRALDVVEQIAANPYLEIVSEDERRQVVMQVSVTGTFLPFDELTVEYVTRSGTRRGPFRLMVATPEEPVERTPVTKGDLIDALRTRREQTDGSVSTRTADIVLSRDLATADIARFEIRHRARGWTYRPPPLSVADETPTVNVLTGEIDRGRSGKARAPISLSAREIDQLVGAPRVFDLEVHPSGQDDTLYAFALSGANSAIVMPARYVLEVADHEPAIAMYDVALVEELLSHLREHAVRYSKAVWRSLTPQDRAMLLEPRTVGLPLADGSLSETPLLSCVRNVVLGFFGNSMIMPFTVPRQLANEADLTSRELEDELLHFHRQAFRPPRTEIALATDGMLGEAVLGACTSAEKIDLTRFWSWDDAPLPVSADDPNEMSTASTLLPTPNGAAAPAYLTDQASPGTGAITQKLPTTEQNLAALLANMPSSSLADDLANQELAKSIAGRGLREAAALAKTGTSTARELAGASEISFEDLVKTLQGADALRRDVAKLASGDVSALLGDPGGAVGLLAATPEAQRADAAASLVSELTGGTGLSGEQKVEAFSALKSFGEGEGLLQGGAATGAKGLALKALMTAFGLPPIL